MSRPLAPWSPFDDGLDPMRIVWILGGLVVLNAFPALVSLLLFPRDTDRGFAWTLAPLESVRLMTGVYVTALSVAVLAIRARTPRAVRTFLLLATVFSLGATTVSLLHVNLLLAHPWWHPVHWFGVYGLLLPVGTFAIVRLAGADAALGAPAGEIGLGIRGIAIAVVALGFVLGAVLLVAPRSQLIGSIWPWAVPPLTARMAGVWIESIVVAIVWTLAHPDRRVMGGLFVLVAVFGATLVLAPLFGDSRRSIGSLAGGSPVYAGLAVAFLALGIAGALRARAIPRVNAPEVRGFARRGAR